MLTMSNKDLEKAKKTSHLGADLDPSFVETFSNRVKDCGFTSKVVIRRLAEFWLGLDRSAQVAIYHGKGVDAFAEYVCSIVDARLTAVGSLPSIPLDPAAPPDLTLPALLYSMRHIVSPTIFRRIMQDVKNVRVGGQIIAQLDADSQSHGEHREKADDAVPLDVAIEQIRIANTQYELLSAENQKWLDDFRAEAIASQRPDTPADHIVADAHRKTAKRKASHKGTASHKPAKSPRSAG